MTFPAGVTTCSVTAGSALDMYGADALIEITITPQLGGSAKRIIWAATGQALTSFTGTFKGVVGAPATFALPHVDQSGFIDGSGASFKNWSYVASVKISSADLGQSTVYSQAFQVLVGQTSVDLDLIPDGSVGAPTSSPVPAVTSVNGSTGAVTVPDPTTVVNAILATRAPGAELGYAEVTSSLTSTAVDVTGAADLAGLSVTVVGKGRPVDIEFFCPSVTHSVASTTVNADVVVNGDIISARNQIGTAKSTATAAGTGPSLYVKRRAVLADTVSYTFTVRVFTAGVAGTSTMYAANPYSPMFLSVVSR